MAPAVRPTPAPPSPVAMPTTPVPVAVPTTPPPSAVLMPHSGEVVKPALVPAIFWLLTIENDGSSVGCGGRTVNSVVKVVKGLCSRSPSISDRPSAHESLPIASAKPLPSLSSSTACTPTSSGPKTSSRFSRTQIRCAPRWQRL